MGRVKQLLIEMEEDHVGASIAEALNIEHFELIQQKYVISDKPCENGLYCIEFSPETSKDFLEKIDNIEGFKVCLDLSEIYNFGDFHYWNIEFDLILEKKDYYQTFINEIENLKLLNRLSTPTKELESILKRHIFIGTVTTLENFLSETFINLTINNDKYFRNFVKNHREFKIQKFELRNIFEYYEKIEDIAKKVMLETIYHHLPKVREMFKFTFRIEFPPISDVYKLVYKRHDLVHRNGKTKEGELLSIEKKDVDNAIEKISEFAKSIADSLDLKGFALTDD